MKKVVVLVAAAMLLASSSFAIIAGSKHDLSSAGPGVSSNTDETCVFCHTPHAADTTVANAPLWNRTVVNATGIYNTATMDALPTLALINGSDVPLCLSCHDGASVGSALVNPPNTLGASPTVGGSLSAAANLGTNMNNDHPVGFYYGDSDATDAEIVAKATVEVGNFTGALSFGNGDEFWCSSCHDVHGIGGISTFLRADNAASGLCTTCHIK